MPSRASKSADSDSTDSDYEENKGREELVKREPAMEGQASRETPNTLNAGIAYSLFKGPKQRRTAAILGTGLVLDALLIAVVHTTEVLNNINLVAPFKTELPTADSVESFFSSVVPVYIAIFLLTLAIATLYYRYSSEASHDENWADTDYYDGNPAGLNKV